MIDKLNNNWSSNWFSFYLFWFQAKFTIFIATFSFLIGHSFGQILPANTGKHTYTFFSPKFVLPYLTSPHLTFIMEFQLIKRIRKEKNWVCLDFQLSQPNSICFASSYIKIKGYKPFFTFTFVFAFCFNQSYQTL